MQSILIANPKGGAGKSTVATNLAGCLAHAGHRVMLGDIDRQQASRDWLAVRPGGAPPIVSWEIKDGEPARPPKGTSHAVLDTPAGLHGKKLAAVIKRVDRVIVPLQPSPFDIKMTRDFLEQLAVEKAVRNGKTFVGMIGNRVDPRTQAARELERFLADYGFPVLTYLRGTQLYIQAAAAGLTIFDLPASKAERDRAHWQGIIDWLAQDGGSG